MSARSEGQAWEDANVRANASARIIAAAILQGRTPEDLVIHLRIHAENVAAEEAARVAWGVARAGNHGTDHSSSNGR